ncbi:MAG TPA: hypothetical protein PK668_19410 [Myxococcota bacterium]|nr:hypothetical protein [Myxococcota bacterium]HRY95100.1 hypothetical protein [Myxococcota bacterium]HSA23264.1 hypothetical protein [Myxococcota bacterium]
MRTACVCVASLALWVAGCAAPSRALIHPEDVTKVFPWPGDKDSLVVRVKPKGQALAQFQEVPVTPDTTFYITDDLGKQFAYTPRLSPIRRLSTVSSVEVRWPIRAPGEAAEDAPPAAGGAVDGGPPPAVAADGGVEPAPAPDGGQAPGRPRD